MADGSKVVGTEIVSARDFFVRRRHRMLGEQRMTRHQVLTHVHYVLPLILLRIGDVRMHGFGSGLEVVDVATRVIQGDQLQMQVDVVRMLGQLVEQLILVDVVAIVLRR